MHTLAVTAMLPTNLGGGGGKVAIIDTEGGFRLKFESLEPKAMTS